jgi:flagellar FliL protein
MPAPNPDPNRPADAPANGRSPGQTPHPGGIHAWLPLIVTALAMPILAYATTNYLLVPKVVRALSSPSSNAPNSAPSPVTEGENRQTATLNKMVVNVAGTMGTRYLLSSITLVGTSADFKSRVDERRDQLLDLATSTLGNKTIADLEKPGARTQLRTELLSVFNNAFGNDFIAEIYITELAIQ